MTKFVSVYFAFVFPLLLMHSIEVCSSEKSLETSINARAEYNDNIFLTTLPHDAVSSFIVTPSLSGIVKEQHWLLKLDSQLRINNSSNHGLDSTGQHFSLSGRYNAERNNFSISVDHDLISSLNTTSTDFGIASQRVERKTQSISPQYTRLITERLSLILSYSYSDTDYLDAENTNFIASFTETGGVSLRYNLNEKDRLTFGFQVVDYKRKDGLSDAQLFDTTAGVDHKFSERLSVDFLIGVTSRNSTNLQTSVLDFFGVSILVPQEFNQKTSSAVLKLGLKYFLETGYVDARLSRNTATNSFGGISETDKLIVNYSESVSSLWGYSASVGYVDTVSSSEITASTDREVLNMEAKAYYSLSKNWNVNVSYRYSQRKFTNVTNSSGGVPKSNQLQAGLAYNFPSLSTF